MSVQLAFLHTVVQRTAASLSVLLSAELSAASAAAEPPAQPMVAPYIRGRPAFCSAAAIEPGLATLQASALMYADTRLGAHYGSWPASSPQLLGSLRVLHGSFIQLTVEMGHLMSQADRCKQRQWTLLRSPSWRLVCCSGCWRCKDYSFLPLALPHISAALDFAPGKCLG